MNRPFIFLLLILLCNCANAEWILNASTEKIDSYIEPTTIIKNKNIVKMWSLQDLKRGLMFGDRLVLSSKDYEEFDCANKTMHLVKSILHSEHMGNGEVITTIDINSNEKKIIPIAPGTVAFIKLKSVCAE